MFYVSLVWFYMLWRDTNCFVWKLVFWLKLNQFCLKQVERAFKKVSPFPISFKDSVRMGAVSVCIVFFNHIFEITPHILLLYTNFISVPFLITTISFCLLWLIPDSQGLTLVWESSWTLLQHILIHKADPPDTDKGPLYGTYEAYWCRLSLRFPCCFLRTESMS